MKILLTENQLLFLIKESTSGLDKFMLTVTNKFPQLTDYVDVIKNFIESLD